eukprot:scaffold13524_cov109-Isochrysis_galbana.AAC.1
MCAPLAEAGDPRAPLVAPAPLLGPWHHEASTMAMLVAAAAFRMGGRASLSPRSSATTSAAPTPMVAPYARRSSGTAREASCLASGHPLAPPMKPIDSRHRRQPARPGAHCPQLCGRAESLPQRPAGQSGEGHQPVALLHRVHGHQHCGGHLPRWRRRRRRRAALRSLGVREPSAERAIVLLQLHLQSPFQHRASPPARLLRRRELGTVGDEPLAAPDPVAPLVRLPPALQVFAQGKDDGDYIRLALELGRDVNPLVAPRLGFLARRGGVLRLPGGLGRPDRLQHARLGTACPAIVAGFEKRLGEAARALRHPVLKLGAELSLARRGRGQEVRSRLSCCRLPMTGHDRLSHGAGQAATGHGRLSHGAKQAGELVTKSGQMFAAAATAHGPCFGACRSEVGTRRDSEALDCAQK